MMSYDIQERNKKDEIARDFIAQVNPYEKKPTLGIDLRALSNYAEDQKINIACNRYLQLLSGNEDNSLISNERIMSEKNERSLKEAYLVHYPVQSEQDKDC